MPLRKQTRRRKLKPWVKIFLCFVLLTALFFGVRGGIYAYFPRLYAEEVSRWSETYGVEERLVYAVIHTESNFRKNVVSVNDACGLMQLLPSTLEWLQTKDPAEQPYTREDLFDPAVNIRYGTLYLSILQKEFGSLEETAAGYHAGMGAVERWLQDETLSPDGETLTEIPYQDTARYVRKIERAYRMYDRLYYK